jgi:hypothetical protein
MINFHWLCLLSLLRLGSRWWSSMRSILHQFYKPNKTRRLYLFFSEKLNRHSQFWHYGSHVRFWPRNDSGNRFHPHKLHITASVERTFMSLEGRLLKLALAGRYDFFIYSSQKVPTINKPIPEMWESDKISGLMIITAKKKSKCGKWMILISICSQKPLKW